jgi:hypothetical protein
MITSRTEARPVPRPGAGASIEEIDAWILAIGGRELTPQEARAWDERIVGGLRPAGEVYHDEDHASARVAETPESCWGKGRKGEKVKS